jgi:hypothetical protein
MPTIDDHYHAEQRHQQRHRRTNEYPGAALRGGMDLVGHDRSITGRRCRPLATLAVERGLGAKRLDRVIDVRNRGYL